MMLFNLLPYRERKKIVDQAFFYLITALVFISAALICLVINKASGYFVNMYGERVSFLENAISVIGAQQKSVDNIDQKIKKMLINKEIIESINQKRVFSLQILNELNLIVPQKSYIESIKTRENGEINITGIASSNKVVSDLMFRVKNNSLFFKVDSLVHTMMKKTKTGSLQEFSLVISPVKNTFKSIDLDENDEGSQKSFNGGN